MITQIDLSILEWIQAHLRCGFLDVFAPLITLFGEGGVFWIALTVLLLVIPKTRKYGLAMFFALALDVLLCNLIIKPLVARPRPYTYRPELELLVEKLSDFSFPSGHTAVAFAGAVALLRSRTRWGIPAVILAALIGLSRLYLYVHYPTDVLCGALLGAACGVFGAFLANWSCKFYKNRRN